MKLIDISTRKHPNTFVMVDDSDHEILSKLKWTPTVSSKDGRAYAYTAKITSGVQKNFLMHRMICGEVGFAVDHKDGNGLNNQRSNLRLATPSQNLQNIKTAWGLSKYKGVFWHKKAGKWRAAISVNKKRLNLGLFIEEKQAAVAYNDAALKHFGEYASLNPL